MLETIAGKVVSKSPYSPVMYGNKNKKSRLLLFLKYGFILRGLGLKLRSVIVQVLAVGVCKCDDGNKNVPDGNGLSCRTAVGDQLRGGYNQLQ